MVRNAKSIAEEQLMKEMIEIYKPSREELSQIYKACIKTFTAKATSWTQRITKNEKGIISFPDDIKLSEVKMVWEVMRTEMGLPIRYKQNDINISIQEEKEQVFFY
jgi:hypothetical protein